MIDGLLQSLPTALVVLAHFLRTEHRLTRIETLIGILMEKSGCKPENNPAEGNTVPLNAPTRHDLK